MNALEAGASYVLGVDSSAAALALAQRNAELNGFGHGPASGTVAFKQADIAQLMYALREDPSARFDLIVLDPPKLAPNRKALERATTK